MSPSRVDLEEFLSAYLVEVDEQLESANAKILEIEAAARQGEASPRAVRDLFRSLHTVKGLSAMVGVEPAVEISHRMETCLRAADRAGGILPLASVSVLLDAMKAIEQRIHELEGGHEASPAPRALLDALDRLEPSAGQVPTTSAHLVLDEAIASKLAPFELDQLAKGAQRGLRAVRADFSPSPTKAERGLSINSVRERVGSIAEIVKVVPVAVPASHDAPGALSFALLLLTSAPDDALAEAVGISPESLRTMAGATQLSPAPPATVVVDDDLAAEAPPQHRNFVRVDVSRLDDAMEHLSTLIVTRSRFAHAIAALTAHGVNTRELAEIMRDNARQLRDLRAAIFRVRMVTVSDVLARVPLLFHRLRADSQKRVQLRLDVGTAELDKGVAERLFPAIMHLVRNAVDHAVETPEERRLVGKPEEATIRIACFTRSNTWLDLTVTDDGRGVDRARVASRLAREMAPGDAGLLDALCHPGLTTRDEVTTTSGRGMGMDIVRRIVVDQLGGALSMATNVGRGTTFTLRVPLTITIVDALTTECLGQRFVVPMAMVEEIIEIDPFQVHYGPTISGAGRARTAMIPRRGGTVSLVDLASALNLSQARAIPKVAVVVHLRGQPIAFGLDRVIGQQEAVVRPLIDPLVQVPGVSGATDLGDGKPTLVLDLVGLGTALVPTRGELAA